MESKRAKLPQFNMAEPFFTMQKRKSIDVFFCQSILDTSRTYERARHRSNKRTANV